MLWRLLVFPVAIGTVAHPARWAMIALAGGSAPALYARQPHRDAGR